MAITYTSAIARDSTLTRRRAMSLERGDVVLVATSVVAILTIGLAGAGRSLPERLNGVPWSLPERLSGVPWSLPERLSGVPWSASEIAGGRRGGAPDANLNEVSDHRQLEPALQPLFENAADCRFAAAELFRFARAASDRGDTLPNVGAILGARVQAAAIDRAPGLDSYRERLRVAREAAAAGRRATPDDLPLFTPKDLATVKPALSVRGLDAFRRTVALYAALSIAGFHIVSFLWRIRGVPGDRLLLATTHLLTAVGFAVLVSRPDPLRDTLLFVRYTQGILIGLGIVGAAALVNFRAATLGHLSYVPLIGGLCLSALLILFGSGPGASTARVNLGPVQPIEAIRLLLALFLAGYFARRWELIRQVRAVSVRRLRVPAWLNLPRADYVLPVLGGVAAAVTFFFVQRDLGPALLLACAFLGMYAVARGRIGLVAAGVALLAAGVHLGYRLHISNTLATRVAMWRAPWDNSVGGGDQVAHALWALATGGTAGTGLGLGDVRYLPAGHTDLVLAAIGEELGAVGLLVVTATFAVLAWRGFRIARAASNDYEYFLAISLTLFLIVPALVMGAGVLGVIPLTGVATPFLSYGGSAMTANFAAIAVLASLAAPTPDVGAGTADVGAGSSRLRNPGAPQTALEPFRRPQRWLAGVLAASALPLVLTFVSVQVLHGDEYLVKPHLGMQADLVRRYQYNPRVLDAMRRIPRGSILDRNGLVLATDDLALARRAREPYADIGIPLDAACANPGERCYPLGGRAFHLLGDARTRQNWSAGNTSYVERDAEARLRGFDDRPTLVTPPASSGGTPAIRRDYRDLVPLVRHRYEPQHSDVQALLQRPRDVRLTIDARLQSRLSEILARYASRSAAGRAAAVVLDPDTGDLLAAASYPWPEGNLEPGTRIALGTATPRGLGAEARSAKAAQDAAALLDRARYGVYPPGSTFKLITAAAALRRDIGLNRTVFSCARLPGGRVGSRIPGWSRPVRDDVLDRHPHGSIDMHDGLVASCNGYFAQLAVMLGPRALADAAAPLGIPLTTQDTGRRLRDTLPQAGYGQGDVLATPLRMARVAAALAADGIVREARWDASQRSPAGQQVFLPPEAARLLAGYLRDAVTSGTGRSLRNHPWRIAGKTGTAEVAGAPSHAWFVGYAPYGPATQRIAFAVIIENAGYGGMMAAPVAADLVTAAGALGIIK